jgi:hypothetical protein
MMSVEKQEYIPMMFVLAHAPLLRDASHVTRLHAPELGLGVMHVTTISVSTVLYYTARQSLSASANR